MNLSNASPKNKMEIRKKYAANVYKRNKKMLIYNNLNLFIFSLFLISLYIVLILNFTFDKEEIQTSCIDKRGSIINNLTCKEKILGGNKELDTFYDISLGALIGSTIGLIFLLIGDLIDSQKRKIMKQMDKKIKKKILKIADDLLSFNFVLTISNIFYGTIFALLFSLIFIGIRLKLLEGYFQYMIFIVMFVFCFRQADIHFSRLSGLWLLIGIGIFLHYILVMIGHDSAIFEVMIKFSIFLVIASASYRFGFRKYLIKKFRLTKLEVFELKQDQE